MFGSTYAVCWNGEQGNRCAGRLHVDARNIVLIGGSNGSCVHETIPRPEISGIEVKGGRLNILRRDGRSLSIGSVDAPGALRELAERLAVSAA
jgi:hypothetical protein